ncbi:hypothetical protein PR202_ga24715 [Eleusine coracana subsp. coracana]|uniref:Transcription factor MYC/MYB N-terminal domain-containing protein n=1 Tax=Eleusine coracana subsp. coracana TaxID=191504 RepID=A0AAV5D9I6_ELECO|nr:hypothetical protein PR202_ga24715 [Eleusine coracana subsp. coracana]
MAVGDALRRLCEEIGWSYAVFWKAIGAADPVHLVWEDGYCGHTSCPAGSETSEALPTEVGCSAADGTMCSLVKKVMASQVATEMNYQFEAGIETIAIIPVLPRGVLQLGSTGLVMENTNFVIYAKKLCSQLNNRLGITSASIKNASSQHSQQRSSHGAFHVQPDDRCSKISSRFPVASEHRTCPDTATVSNSASSNVLLNPSLLKVAQRSGRPIREHTFCAKPDVRFEQQTSYCESRFRSNTQSADMSSGLVWPSLISVKKQSLLLNNTGSFGFSNNADSSADLARNILLKSLVCRDSSADEKANINMAHERYGCPMREMILRTLISSLEVAE